MAGPSGLQVGRAVRRLELAAAWAILFNLRFFPSFLALHTPEFI
jgi:hypothetical protein